MFVWLNYVIIFCQDFLGNFQTAQETIVQASQAAAEVAKQNMQEAYDNATRIELDIELQVGFVVWTNKTSTKLFSK